MRDLKKIEENFFIAYNLLDILKNSLKLEIEEKELSYGYIDLLAIINANMEKFWEEF